LKIEGDDRPGLGTQISRAIGSAGVNMRGTSAMVVGRKFVCYLGFDTASAANKAATALRRVGKK
jgi:predicted amino acid-binding ACT domain protein